ncbi:transposase, partial [Escherichia coli]
AFEHYNEWHPHSALGYRSPQEYLRQRTSNGLSDNRCLEIQGQIPHLNANNSNKYSQHIHF